MLWLVLTMIGCRIKRELEEKGVRARAKIVSSIVCCCVVRMWRKRECRVKTAIKKGKEIVRETEKKNPTHGEHKRKIEKQGMRRMHQPHLQVRMCQSPPCGLGSSPSWRNPSAEVTPASCPCARTSLMAGGAAAGVVTMGDALPYCANAS